MSIHALMFGSAMSHRDACKAHSTRWRRWDIEVRYFAARLIAGDQR